MAATGVLVPEAPVDKDNASIAREHDVWGAGKISAVEAEPKPCCVQQTADRQLGFRVLLFYGAHFRQKRWTEVLLQPQIY